MGTCTNCGKELRPGDKFCQYCGQQVDTAGEEQPAYAGVSSAPLQAPHSYDSPQSQPAFNSGGASHGGARGSSQPGAARLVVRVSPTAEPGAVVDDGEREFVLDGRDIAIGRAPSCDIVLAGDQLASRRHALLRFKDGEYSVVDLGSSNGTYINDQEIHGETVLHDGDRLTIGGHDLAFSTGSASPSASILGASLAPAEPSTPLLETAPSLSAVNLPSPTAAAESAQADDNATQLAEPAAETQPTGRENSFIVATAPAEQDAANGANHHEEVATEMQNPPAVAAESQEQPEASQQPAALGQQAALEVPEADAGELDNLRAQLAEISTALARKADEEYRLASRLRAALVEVRDQLGALLRDHGAGSYETGQPASERDYGDLIAIARQAAESPLDHLTSFVKHAGEIADALEAAQANQGDGGDTGELLAGVEALKARLDETLG